MAENPLKYKVILEKDNVELRYYENVLIATVSSSGELFSERNSNFSKLANYIFGGNQQNEEIGMTSPVIMNSDSGTTRMHFIMPDRYSKENLPAPTNEDIQIQELESFYALAVTFGGYVNQQKYEQGVDELLAFAMDNKLRHNKEFMLMGFDPPFKTENRKNEILLKLTETPEIK